MEKEIEKIEVSGRGQTHVKMEDLCTQSYKQSRNFGSTSHLGIDRIKVSEKGVHDFESEKAKESLFTGIGGKMDEEQEILKNRSRSGCDQRSSPVMSSSLLQSATSVEASLYEFSEEESGYSNCSRLATLEFQKQIDGPSGQCSPDSVLESFDTKHPSTFECSESTGQQSQFQVSISESEEMCSEGSEMVVSGNEEEKEEGIVDLSYNSGKVHRWLGDDGSRNFCYIVDVLDEAGCFKERPILDIIQSWDCLECPISPLVFEALEKKYGRPACWEKSDRRLLFDLINSGLTDILKQLLNFHSRAMSALQRHFIAGMKRGEVEDLLWKTVVTLEKEKSIDASEKVVEGAMKWWEVDEKDTNVLCRELETSLFEELVMESISLWIR